MSETPNIIIEKQSWHGGAWKVAYADFVTAMMAFFLLLWLLNVSTDEQREAISNFFDPTHPKASTRESGAGGVMGGLSMSTEGAQATNKQDMVNKTPTGTAGNKSREGKRNAKPQTAVEKAKEAAKEMLRKKEEQNFQSAKEAIEKAIQDDPGLAELAKNLMVDITPEGLRIQIVDQDGNAMFASGSARMYDKTRKLMQKVSEIIMKLPNEISVRGHTDSVPYGPGSDYTNWELSTDRANASRRVLEDTGVPSSRLNNVVGKADTDHLLPEDPTNAQNRRISIILLKEELTDPDYEEKAEAVAEEEGLYDDFEDDVVEQDSAPAPPPIGTFKRTPGAVEFP